MPSRCDSCKACTTLYSSNKNPIRFVPQLILAKFAEKLNKIRYKLCKSCIKTYFGCSKHDNCNVARRKYGCFTKKVKENFYLTQSGNFTCKDDVEPCQVEIFSRISSKVKASPNTTEKKYTTLLTSQRKRKERQRLNYVSKAVINSKLNKNISTYNNQLCKLELFQLRTCVKAAQNGFTRRKYLAIKELLPDLKILVPGVYESSICLDRILPSKYKYDKMFKKIKTKLTSKLYEVESFETNQVATTHF